MHQSNLDFLADMQTKHPEHFNNCKVFEVGSRDWCGTSRGYFTNCEYLGTDRLAGAGVDIVCEAEEFVPTNPPYDTFICFSVFEHTPKWREILEHNLQWVRPGGLVLLVWGAEGNPSHDPEPWAQVLVKDFYAFAKTLPMTIEDGFFDDTRYSGPPFGAYTVIAQKQ